jgi:hypothetical protein
MLYYSLCYAGFVRQKRRKRVASFIKEKITSSAFLSNETGTSKHYIIKIAPDTPNSRPFYSVNAGYPDIQLNTVSNADNNKNSKPG